MSNEHDVAKEVQDRLTGVLGGRLELDETIAGIRSTLFYAMAVAISEAIALGDGVIDDRERRHMAEVLGRLGLVPEEAAESAAALLEGATLADLLRPQILREVGQLLDEPAATLLFAVGLEMALAEGVIQEEERVLLARIEECLPVNKITCDLLLESRSNGVQVGATEAAPLSVIHPTAVLHLGVGASRLATAVLSTTSTNQECRPVCDLPATPAVERLAMLARGRKELLAVYDELLDMARYLPPRRAEALTASRELLGAERFQITVVGEFSRGKSTLINALLGGPVLPRAMVPCTSGIVRLRHGLDPAFWIGEWPGDGQQRKVPYPEFCKALYSGTTEETIDRLNGPRGPTKMGIAAIPHPILEHGVEILDTPGLNESEQLELMVQAEAERSDAFIVVISGVQSVTRLELDAVRQLRDDKSGAATFVVCNHMNLVPPGQQETVRARVMANLKDLTDGPDRIFFVGAEPALGHMLGTCEAAQWAENLDELRAALMRFLARDRGTATIRSHMGTLEGACAHLEESIRGLIAHEQTRAHEAQQAEESDVLKQVDWIRAEIDSVDDRRDSMNNRLKRFLNDLSAQAEEITEAALNDVAARLPKAAKNWKSEVSILKPWEVARDFGKQVERYVEREINARLKRDLGRATEQLVAEAAHDLGQDSAPLYDAAYSVNLSALSIEQARDDPEGAGQRILKAVVGVALVGPAGVLAGALPISQIVAMTIAVAITAILVALFSGGPVTLAIAVAITAATYFGFQSVTAKDALRDKLVAKVCDKLPEILPEARTRIRADIEQKTMDMERQLAGEISKLRTQATRNLAALEQQLEDLRSDQSEDRGTHFDPDLARIVALGDRLEVVRTGLAINPTMSANS